MRTLACALGDVAMPKYLIKYIEKTSIGRQSPLFVHLPIDMSRYADADKDAISRTKGFIGASQTGRAPNATVHHLFVVHNGLGKARLVYKFIGNIQFIKNTANDS